MDNFSEIIVDLIDYAVSNQAGDNVATYQDFVLE